MHKIAAQIIDQRGDYILSLKENQGNLYKEVSAFFKQAQAACWQGIEYSYSETTEAGHHRIEHRQVWAVSIDQVPELAEAKKWNGFATVVMVKRSRKLWNKRTTLRLFLHHKYISRCYYFGQSYSLSLGSLKQPSLGIRCDI